MDVQYRDRLSHIREDKKMSKISIKDMNLYYGDFHALKNVNLEIEENKITAFIGPSGCGKSTLLNIIAGILPLDGGEVSIHQSIVSAPGKMVPTEKRNINMVFQDFALWPHMKARDNILYGLKVKKTTKERDGESVK